jgi:hypothetical protein
MGLWLLLACGVSDLFSGQAGIYRSQRIGHAKHRALAEEGIRPPWPQ